MCLVLYQGIFTIYNDERTKDKHFFIATCQQSFHMRYILGLSRWELTRRDETF